MTATVVEPTYCEKCGHELRRDKINAYNKYTGEGISIPYCPRCDNEPMRG